MSLIGVAKSGAGNLSTEAHVIELAAHGAKACFNVAQTLTVCQLGKGKSKELIPARKSAEFVIATITSHAFLELICRNVIHQLREYRSAGIHAPLSGAGLERLVTRLARLERPKRSEQIQIEKSWSPPNSC